MRLFVLTSLDDLPRQTHTISLRSPAIMAEHPHPPASPGRGSGGNHSDHDDTKDDKQSSGLKKKRIQQACRPCGIKRVKCDGAHPCITCTRSGEICEYGLPKKRGPPKGSTRGGSKAAKRKAQAQDSDARTNAREAAAAAPIQSTRDYAAGPSASVDTSVPLSRPLPPPVPETEWSRSAAPAHIASPNSFASASSYTRYPPHAGASQPIPYPPAIPPYQAATPSAAIRATGAYPSDAYTDPFSRSAHASPDSSYRTDSHRTSGSNHDGSVGSPNPGGVTISSPAYYPPHSYPSRYDPASASHASYRHRTEPFYRGSSSGLGLIRPSIGASDRKLPPLDFHVSRPAIRSSPSSPSNYRRLSSTSDTYESGLSGRPSASRSTTKFGAPYARPAPITSSSIDGSRYDDRSLHSSTAAVDSQLLGHSGWSAASQANPTQQPDAKSNAARADRASTDRPASLRQTHAGGNNQLLVEGTLLQLRRDRDREHERSKNDEASTSSATGGFDAPQDPPEDINLEPLLWVEPGDASRQGINRSGVTLHRPEIPPLIQERLFTIFWGIVQTIWPALYKPALSLTGFNVIDPEKSPMLHNAACALAAVAWDSGEFGVSEEDTEATQSDWVERTASDLSFSQGPDLLGNGTSLRRLSAADLGDIFLARAKYYLVKTNNEPSLETIQSLMFMALREGGNGRASQASAYISTACRMCIDLGLHRQRDFSSVLGLHFSHAEEQARRRIFWCLYLLDKTSSASLGRPVTLRYVEIDCPLPNVDEADEHETWADSTNNSSLIKDRARSMLLKTPVAAMTHLRFGVRLGHICEQIIAIYTHVQRSGDDDDGGLSPADRVDSDSDGAVPEWETRLVRLHRKLEEWERDLPSRLRFDNPSHHLPNTLSQHLWFQACKVMLHRPYILKQSSRPDLPASHRICTDAVGSICDILTAYDHNFGMRKLSSTFTYCIFTASTIEIANTTSTDAATALEAKRRLRKFMTWLSRMSGTWQSASHHLKILEQLGHGIDADLDGTGLPSHREASVPGSMVASRADSPSAAAAVAASTGAMAKSAAMDVGPSPSSFAKDAQGVSVDSGSLQSVATDQEQQQLASAANASGMTLPYAGMPVTTDDLTNLSVPGPIGAPMYPMRSLASFQMGPTLQDDLHAQFQAQAQGQNPGAFYGWPTAANATRVDASSSSTNAASVYDASNAGALHPAATAQQSIPHKMAADPTATAAAAAAAAAAATVSNNAASTVASGAVNPTAYLKLHDTSYWGAMPLASEDPLSWANFTSSYIEALNGMTQPLSSSVTTPPNTVSYPVTAASAGNGGRCDNASAMQQP